MTQTDLTDVRQAAARPRSARAPLELDTVRRIHPSKRRLRVSDSMA